MRTLDFYSYGMTNEAHHERFDAILLDQGNSNWSYWLQVGTDTVWAIAHDGSGAQNHRFSSVDYWIDYYNREHAA